MTLLYFLTITGSNGLNLCWYFSTIISGSTETAQFLLDIGAPAGIYDNEGNSCISYLLEKMPHVAYCALHQFVVTNMSLKQSDMYLKHLENDTKGKHSMIQKSPLEVSGFPLSMVYSFFFHPGGWTNFSRGRTENIFSRAKKNEVNISKGFVPKIRKKPNFHI